MGTARSRRRRARPAALFARLMIAVVVAGALAPVGVVGAQDLPVVPEAPSDIEPIAECVVVNGDGTITGFFGYSNGTGRDLVVPKYPGNRTDEVTGRPTTRFRAGRVVADFSVTSSASSITWYFGGREATVTAASLPCSTSPTVSEAPLSLLLMLAPAGLTGWWLRRRRRRGPLPC